MLSTDILAALTNKDILNQRFATDLSEQTNDILSEMARWLRSKLSDTHSLFGEELTPAKVRRFNNLLSTIEDKLDEVYSTINDLYMEQFRGLAIDDVDFVSQVINEELKENFLMTKPGDARLWSAVMDNPLHFPDDIKAPYVNFAQMVESLDINAKRVADTISGGYYAGLTNQELVRQLIGTKKNNYQDGLVDISRRDANRIIRTSLTHVTSQARKRLYDDNKDIAFGYRIVATIDTRTSNICKSLDGRVIKFTAPKSAQILPPFHHNCRSATVPEIYGRALKDSGATRAVNFKARKGAEKGTVGQVDAQQTYLDILRSQPLSQIELALGKVRAEIFKNAGLTTDEFRQALADNMGRPLTLAEMAKKNRKILDYMKSRKDLEVYVDD